VRRFAKPKPKERRSVPIPDNLRSSLRDVRQIIQDSVNNPDSRIDYGDAIQADGICGGRTGKKLRPFVLTFFPADDWERGRWFLTLHQTEIEDIADGVLASLPMYCCRSADCRCKFREPDDQCFFCDYESDPDRGRFTMPEATSRLEAIGIRGVSESLTFEATKALFGDPFKQGGGGVVSGITVDPWAKFRIGDRDIHIEFGTRSGRITAVTI
jgi:hypothetical protein